MAVSLRGVSKTFPAQSGTCVGLKEILVRLPHYLAWLRQRRPFVALRDVTLDVPRGECLGIIGRNGAGKSTLLAMIAGVIRPTCGTVAIRGRCSSILDLGAGFHSQLTGRENIVLNAVLLGLTRAEVAGRIESIVEFSGLKDFIDAPIRTYSSGMIGRLGFSVAVHLEPDILLVDEVIAVGDLGFQEKCFAKIAEFRCRRVTILIASHQLHRVAEICDRAVLLDGVRGPVAGPPREVIAVYQERVKGG